MYIPPCPECKSEKSLMYDIISDDWICKNCGYTIYGGYFDDEE
jgi:ribosomal protein L37AE/L43A